jgi:hypothetical protein
MQSGRQDLSGWTDKPGCNVRANAKTGGEICAEDNSVIRLLPSLILPGLAAGTSSMMASAKSGRFFNPSRGRFLAANSQIFLRKLPEIHLGDRLSIVNN